MIEIYLVYDNCKHPRNIGIDTPELVEKCKQNLKNQLHSFCKLINSEVNFNYLLRPNLGYWITDFLIDEGQKISPIILPVKQDFQISKKNTKIYLEYVEKLKKNGADITYHYEKKEFENLNVFQNKELILRILYRSMFRISKMCDIGLAFSQQSIIRDELSYKVFLQNRMNCFYYNYLSGFFRIFEFER